MSIPPHHTTKSARRASLRQRVVSWGSREAGSANHVLTNWEAFLSGEPERAEHELLDHFTQHDSELKQLYISILRKRARALGLTYKDNLLYHVGFHACLGVQDVLEAFTTLTWPLTTVNRS